MKKILLLFILLVVLCSCSNNKYDKEINLVIKKERVFLRNVDKTYEQNLKRKDCIIEVFEDGKYIKISSYHTENSKKKGNMSSTLYERMFNGKYESLLYTDKVDGLLPNYVEKNGEEKK